MTVAKLFTHGRSQAVRLPAEFRFEGTEVHVRRVGNEVVLSAPPRADLQAMLDALNGFEPGVRLEREQPAALRRAAVEPKIAPRPAWAAQRLQPPRPGSRSTEIRGNSSPNACWCSCERPRR